MLKVAFGLLFASVLFSTAHGASIFVYINNEGNRLITDHPRSDLVGYKLLKTYGVDDYFGSPDRPGNGSSVLTPRASKYDSLIVAKADKTGLEPALLKAMVHVESAFNPDALSPKGAKGLMQLMPATAKRFGVTTRADPIASLDGGSRYMQYLLTLFDQNTRLALAAYNAGENAVTKYNGIPPYPETENYVEKVMLLRDQYRINLAG